MFLGNKHATYIYTILLLIWMIISIHMGYRYVSYSSQTSQGKGGTFIEASIEKTNYLPYVTNNDHDKFYQSFLFNGCVYPSFSGTTISYREELCTVDTKDYKSFTITPKIKKYRSDGEPFTLNDLYFTYNTLLKENYRNIGALDSYKSVSVIANEEDEQIQVVFPKASVDNMIFFTNFILPAHLLANQELEPYIEMFYQNPVGTNCGRIVSEQLAKDNIIFDLSACEDIPLKYYQIKRFDDEASLSTYTQQQKDTIDLIIDDKHHIGYTNNSVILNKFITLFFNTTRVSMSSDVRQALASLVHNTIYVGNQLEETLVQDHFLFDAFADPLGSGDLATLLTQATSKKKIQAITTGSIDTIPTTINFSDDTATEQEYILMKKIIDKQQINLTFTKTYDKISISHNEGVEYFPESFDKTTKSSFYNLNPLYRNVAEGRNTYTIKTYIGEQHQDTFNVILYYLEEPSYPSKEEVIIEDEAFNPIRIVYFEDIHTTAIAKRLQEVFTDKNIHDFFTFQTFDDPNTFAGKIESKDYDIVIRSINMGLRKDISNIFETTSSNINPSLYNNTALAKQTNEYFLFGQTDRQSVKKNIDTTYLQDTPFIILGKELGSILIKDSLEFSYPFRLYVLGRRKDFVKDLPLFQHVNVNWDKVRKRNNFKAFLQQSPQQEQ